MKTKNVLGDISPELAKSRPSFRSGVLSLSNIHGRMRFGNYVFGNDVEAMRKDWNAIGNDIKQAMDCYAQ